MRPDVARKPKLLSKILQARHLPVDPKANAHELDRLVQSTEPLANLCDAAECQVRGDLRVAGWGLGVGGLGLGVESGVEGLWTE